MPISIREVAIMCEAYSTYTRDPMLVKTLCVGFACALLTLAAQGAEKPNWLDIESRIQYGYYTEDVRALRNVMELLGPSDSDSASRRYYAALANYRLSQLAFASDKSRAKETADACVDNLDQAAKLQRDSAEPLALESACLELLASL